jgi:peptidoglycan-associated lipoprotein
MKENIMKVLCVSGVVVSLALFTSGCTKENVPSDPANDINSGNDTHVSKDTADTGDTAGSVETIDDKGNGSSRSLANFKFVEGRTHEGMLPIYFDFDSSAIRDDQRARIEGNADFLKANPNYKVIIEGNTDERGTTEYNIALGEHRAQVAKKYLINLGVSAGQLSTFSYGEEKPLLFGHDEYSWSQNRRDDFVIQ